MIKVYGDPIFFKKLKIPFTPTHIKSINEKEVIDIFDILYHSLEDRVIAEFIGSDGQKAKVRIKGSVLNEIDYEFIKPKRCGCQCIFCFIDQLPKGLRSSLYHKDEDYRFSYLYGNYVTLANISEKDLTRIINYKLTPLYISVHSTDEKIRSFMLGRKKLIPIMEILKRLSEGGISFHTQVVLCPGINDGEALKKTIEDLRTLYPAVATVAVVPVGLTGHRKGLYQLKNVDKKVAEKTFSIVSEYQRRYMKELKHPFVYLSDEFYLLLGEKIPKAAFYKGFPQYENGVGIVRKFIDNAERLLKRDLKGINNSMRGAVVTGEISYPVVKPYIDRLAEKLKIDLELIPIKNRLFGGYVTVTGLVSGLDIVEGLKGKVFDVIFVANVMLRERENYFLDNMTLSELSKKLKAMVVQFEPSLSALYNKIKAIKHKKIGG